MDSFESLAVSISRYRKSRTEKSRFSTNCHQAPGRAGRLRELAGEARESGGSKSQLRLSPTVLPSLFNSFKHAFQHDGNSAIVRTFTTTTLLYRVFAVFATRDSETARRGARPPSHIEMREHETLNSKTRTRSRSE